MLPIGSVSFALIFLAISAIDSLAPFGGWLPLRSTWLGRSVLPSLACPVVAPFPTPGLAPAGCDVLDPFVLPAVEPPVWPFPCWIDGSPFCPTLMFESSTLLCVVVMFARSTDTKMRSSKPGINAAESQAPTTANANTQMDRLLTNLIVYSSSVRPRPGPSCTHWDGRDSRPYFAPSGRQLGPNSAQRDPFGPENHCSAPMQRT